MSSSDPFFSVITCTKNMGRYLRENIDSVKNQDFNNYEHLFVDGYSTDNTKVLIENYVENEDRARLILREPRGISNAMNEGVKASRGKYLIHLHGDDCLYDNKVLGRLYNFLGKHPDLDWLYGKIEVIERDGGTVGFFPERGWLQLSSRNFWAYQLLKFYNYIPHQAVVIKKEVFNRFGFFDENINSKMDYDLWLRIAKETKWNFLNTCISKFMIRPKAQSSSLNKKKENLRNLRVIQKEHLGRLEFYIARSINKLICVINSTLR